MALTSLDVKLIYNATANSTTAAHDVFAGGDQINTILSDNKWAFPDLQEIGAINIAGAGGSYDQIEVTTLADKKHRYVNGLIADTGSNNNQIACKFLYSPVLFKAFKDVLDAEMRGTKKNSCEYIVAIPGGGHFVLNASIASVQMESVAVNGALTFTVTLAVNDIEMNAAEFVVEGSV